jgi:hypothetical protein
MSRFYGMSIRISNHDPVRVAAIVEVAEEEWPFGGLTDNGTALSGYGEDNLIASCSKKDFAEQFTAVIWRANGAYCDVEIIATYLEDLPCETYCLAKADYTRLITGQPDAQPAEGVDDEDHIDRGH